MKTTIIYAFFIIYFTSCQNKPEKKDNKSSDAIKHTMLSELPLCPVDTFVDIRDKNIYSLIRIGKQTWTKGIIKYKPNKGKVFHSYLYNWDAAIDACPQTFKIPSDNDWSDLFRYVYDSIILRSSPQLIENLSEDTQNMYCNECKEKLRKAGLPYGLRLDSTIAKFTNYEFLKILENRGNEMAIMFLYLERMGFCTSGSGFKYQGGLGLDDYSYFWSSTTDNQKNHKYIPIYTGYYCQGCGYKFFMKYNNDFGFNLKCIKKN